MTLIGQNEEIKKIVCDCSQSYCACSTIHARTLVVSGLDPRRNGAETIPTNVMEGEWEKTAEGMMHNFAESGRPVFRVTIVLERWELKSKEKGVNWWRPWLDSSHRYFRQSAKSLRISCRFDKRVITESRSAGSLPAKENLGSMVILAEFPVGNTFLTLTWMYREMCCENTSRNSQNFLNNRNLPNSRSNCVFLKNIGKGPILHHNCRSKTWWNENINVVSIFSLEVKNSPAW